MIVTHHQVPDDDSGEEERDADLAGDPHAVPHGLYPLPAEDSEHDHEAVHEVNKVPAWHCLPWESLHIICKVVVVVKYYEVFLSYSPT